MDYLESTLLFISLLGLGLYILGSKFIIKKISIQKLIIAIFLLLMILSSSVAYFSNRLLISAKKISQYEETRTQLLDLARELSQSSDDLTSMVRLYTATANKKYKDYFYRISEIRDGKIPHPQNYNLAFWDKVLDGNIKPLYNGDDYSITERLRELGSPDDEINILSSAKQASDDLMSLEQIAINAVEGIFMDSDSNFTINGKPNLNLASQLVNGPKYLQAKSQIMSKIEEFLTLADERTENELAKLIKQDEDIVFSVILLVLFALVSCVFSFIYIRKKVFNPSNYIKDFMKKLQDGDYSLRLKHDSNDEMGGLVSSINNMAEQIELRNNELSELNATLIGQTNALNEAAVVSITDINGILLQVNDKFCTTSGYSKEELIGKSHNIVNSGFHDKTFWKEMWKTIESGNLKPGLIKNKTKDGKYYWIDNVISPIKNKEEIPIQYIGIGFDVTERMLNAELAATEKEKANIILNSITQGIFGTDIDGNITFINPAAKNMLGYSTDELITKNAHHTFHHHDEKGKLNEHDLFEIIIKGNFNKMVEDILWRKDGSFFHVEYSANPLYIDNKLFGYVFVFIDKTDAKQKELLLKVAQEKLDLALEAGKLGIWDFDFKNNIIGLDKRAQEIHGYRQGEFNRHFETYIKHIHPDDLDSYMAKVEEGTRVGGNYHNSYRIITSSGEIRHIFEQGINQKDESGEVVYGVGVLMDSTEFEKSKEQLNILNVAIEQSPISVVITDLQGKIQFVNPTFTQITGYSSEEAIGQNPSILKSGIHDNNFYKEMWETITDGNVWSGEICNKNKHGELFWEKAAISPVINEKKKIINFVALKIDITQQKQFENELKLAKQAADKIVDAMPIPTAVTKLENGKILRVNHAMAMFHLVEMEEFENMKSGDWYADNKSRPKLISKMEKHGYLSNEEVKFKRYKTGEIRDCLVSFIPIKYMDEDGLVGSIIDISDLKKIQSELENAKQMAEAATVAKSQFLATMSHEIRTPMNAIIGLSNLVLQTNLTQKQLDYLQKIEKSAQALLGIINDILDFSKIEAGKLVIENTDFDLEDVLNTVSHLISHKAQEKGLEFAIDIDKNVPLSLIGDSLRVSQIITNYCSNAVKFTEKGEIIVSAEIDEIIKDKIKLKFSVKDTGIGLSEEQKNKMFQSFSQADQSTTRKYGGTGLGLAISKKIAELMGGSVGVTSKLGIGSTFYFTAEFGIQAEQKRKEFIPSVDLRGMKVLVCDDNEIAREIITKALETFTFNVTTVNSGVEAIKTIEMYKDDPFNLIMMDFKMPGMNGIETSKIIRQEKNIKIPFIIMISAFGNDKVASKAKKAGINAFINKPVTYSTLFDTIMKVFGKKVRTKRGEQNDSLKLKDELKQISGTNILLVEDNEINQLVATDLLKGVGFNVDIADNGKIAVEKMLQSGSPSKYKIVLMDLQMPEMDGYKATEEIRKIDTYNDVPIVAMTADAMSGIREKCFESGMQDYITKPISPLDVFKTLLNWIKSDNTEDKIESLNEENSKNISDADVIPSIEGIDIDDGILRLGGNKKLFISLLKKFYNNNINFRTKILEAYNLGDKEFTIRLAHTLKGVSANLGAKDLAAQAKLLEEDLNNNDGNNFKEILNQTFLTLSLLLDSIYSKILLADNEKKSVILSKENSISKLEKLKKLINEYNPNAVEKLEEIGIIKGYEEEFIELKKMLSEYNFEDAIKLLNKIITN